MIDIVTGASQGIGKAIAGAIAEARSHCINDDSNGHPHDAARDKYQLVLVGRNTERGSKVAQEIATATGLDVSFQECNVGNFQQVQALRHRLLQEHSVDTIRVGVLVNDAAECPHQQRWVDHPRRQPDGNVVTEQLDAQFATNVLGYHFMLRTFGMDAEYVVNIASNWAGDLDLQDLNFRRRSYDNDTAYRQAKQADRMISVFWADRLKEQQQQKQQSRGKDDYTKVNACHPGDPRTTLSTALGYNMYAKSPDVSFVRNSRNPILHLCGLTKSSGAVTSGGWYDGGTKPHQEYFAKNRKEMEALFDVCESYCV